MEWKRLQGIPLFRGCKEWKKLQGIEKVARNINAEEENDQSAESLGESEVGTASEIVGEDQWGRDMKRK